MRIALLTNGLFPWVVGGMQKHSTNLIREWALMGVDLDVYFTQAPGYPAASEIQEALVPNQTAGRVRFFASAPSWLPYFPLHHYADCYVESCRIAEQLMRELPQPEFIYAQGLTGWKLLRMKRRGVQLPPVGVNLHGMEGSQEFKGGIRERLLKWVGGPIERWLLRHANVALSLGGRLDEIIRKVAPQVTILHSGNGIQHEWLSDHVDAHSSPRKFVFVGRCTPRKGLHVLYEAVRRLPPETAFEVHLLGDIPESERLNVPRLIYHGGVTNETQMKSILRQMDVLVCPSLAEGVPTVVLEGMASGLAIIATDVGATRELVDESNGWLIPAGDAATLALAMAKAISQHDGELRKLKQRSVEKVNPHLWSSVACETVDGIRRYLGQGKQGFVY